MNNKIHSAFEGIHADEALVKKTAAYVVRRRRKNFKPGLLAAVVLILLIPAILTPVYVYNQYFTAAAYVSIDVNPSLELALNRRDKVISTFAYNADGERILNENPLRGKGYDEATALVLSSLQADGYLRGEVLVSVSVQTNDSQREQLLCAALQQLINQSLQNVPANTEVEVFPVSAEVWINARGCHISPAKYMAIQELLAVDEEASLEEYSGSTITQIRQHMQKGQHHSHGSGGKHHGGQ